MKNQNSFYLNKLSLVLVACCLLPLSSILRAVPQIQTEEISTKVEGEKAEVSLPKYLELTYEAHDISDEKGLRFHFDGDLPWKSLDLAFDTDHFVIELPQVEIPKAGKFITPEQGPFSKIGFFSAR